MKQELDEKLCNDFPNLYGDRTAPMTQTCMCWGFEVGEGWYDLVYELSSKLESLIKILPPKERVHIKASQVKEKYGELRFYMTSATDEMWNLIEEAEEKSRQICEVCGKLGKVRPGGWIVTRCDECYKQRNQ